MKDTFIPKGIVFESDIPKKKSGHFNLTNWFRKTAKRLNVPFFDDCCGTGSDVSPVGYTELGGVVRYNSVSKEFVTVDVSSQITGFSGVIVAVEGTYTFTNGSLTTFVPTP